MKSHIPGKIELSVLIVMAVICTIVVAVSSQRDFALAACTAPVFLVSALLGFRKSELLRVSQPASTVLESESAAK